MLFKRKPKAILNAEESAVITKAIEQAEQKTSGEIRVFIEQYCRFVNATDRAIEIFDQLQMQKTKERNGVVVYLATKDKQIAIWGDEGIHTKVGNSFWNEMVQKAILNFNASNYIQGLTDIIGKIGEALEKHFSYEKSKDQNELSNNIAYGK